MRINQTLGYDSLVAHTNNNTLQIPALAAAIEQLLGQPWQGLRPDLQVHQGSPDNSGLTRWYLEDPLTTDRFALGVDEHRLVTALAARSKLTNAMQWYQQQFGDLPPPAAIANILKSFINENLAVRPAEAGSPPLAAKPPFWRRLYALRIPVIRPDAALTAVLPWVRWLGHHWLRILFLLVGMLGFALMLPQADRFLATSGYLLTAQGVTALALTLVLLKIGHEFCHAFVAKSYGLHVRSMGLVVILFWPILYTDVTDAWRLADRKQRLNIALAGIAFELCVAALALFMWSFLPPGLWQNLAFVVAFTSVLGTVLINANPFMRFDGYYALMDWWGVDNLQPRALALTQHYWRRLAVNWQGDIPEHHPQQKRLVAYGIGVWIYRIILTLIIAIAAYALLNPYIGIALFLLVFVGMLILPTFNELNTLRKERRQWGSHRRVMISGIAVLAIALLLFIPLPYSQTSPSLLLPADYQRLQAPNGGQVISTIPVIGQSVTHNSVVLQLTNPELTQQVSDADFQLRRVTAQRNALTGRGDEGGYRNWLLAEQQRLLAKRSTAQEANAALDLVSNLNGHVRYVLPDINTGDWVPANQVLIEIADPSQAVLRVYFSQDHVNQAVPKTLSFSCTGLDLQTVGLTNEKGNDINLAQHNGNQLQPAQQFLNPAWYDEAGGSIATRPTNDKPEPRDAWYSADYRVAIQESDETTQLPLGYPCEATLQTEYRSIARRIADMLTGQLSDDGVI